MKMRIIAAAVLIPVLLAVLFIAPPVLLAILVGVVCAIGAYELLVGTGLVKHMRLIFYTVVMAFTVPVLSYFAVENAWFMLSAFAYIALLFGELLISKAKLRFDRLCICIAGGMVIPFLLSSLVHLMGNGTNRQLILLPFILAFMADTGAYFVGCSFGSHKLAPTISPNKSVEGLLGGVLFDVLGMLIYCLIIDLAVGAHVNYLFAITYGIIGAFAGTFGDLIFSAIKRQTGIKDYGKLIPGHGGVLDRFDSVIIVAPLVEILLALLPVVE